MFELQNFKIPSTYNHIKWKACPYICLKYLQSTMTAVWKHLFNLQEMLQNVLLEIAVLGLYFDSSFCFSYWMYLYQSRHLLHRSTAILPTGLFLKLLGPNLVGRHYSCSFWALPDWILTLHCFTRSRFFHLLSLPLCPQSFVFSSPISPLGGLWFAGLSPSLWRGIPGPSGPVSTQGGVV